MKRALITLPLAALLLLSGCGAAETFETVADEMAPAVSVQKHIAVALPDNAVQTQGDGEEILYMCDGYCVCLETLACANIEEAVEQLTGYEAEKLQIIPTEQNGIQRYDMVWYSTGEGGDQMNRAGILADGGSYYAVTAMADAATVGSLNKTWNDLFNSISLNTD